MIIIDIIIVCMIAGSFIYGYKKGLVNIVTSLVGFVLALILAFVFSGSVANYVKNNTPFYTEIRTSVEATLNLLIKDNNSEDNEKTSNESGFIAGVKDDILNASDELKGQIVQENTDKISMYVLKAISFILIYILVITIASILNMMLNGIFSLPLLDSVNKMSGMLANGFVTVLKIQIILAVLYMISGISIFGNIVDLVNETSFVKVLYNNNIVTTLMTQFFK